MSANAPLTYRPLDASQVEEEESLRDILIQCFAFPPARWKAYYDLVGAENLRVLLRDDRVIAGLVLIHMGQWFGGRSVPMTGIAAVGVEPQSRAGGIGHTLMKRMLEELRALGIPLSALYASTQHLYRGLGYEQAGTRVKYTLSLRELPPSRRPDRSIPLHAVEATVPGPFKVPYDRLGAATNGMLDRGRAIWQRVLHRGEQEVLYAYLVGDREEPDGYVIYALERKDSGHDIGVRDLVALSPAAYRRLLTFFLDDRSVANDVKWCGPPTDPLLCVTEEQQYSQTSVQERWMLRLVDVPKAFEARGYPAGIEGELHIEAEDDLLPDNAGRWILRVADGRGTVTRGGRGDLRGHVRGLAPLYSGMLTPADLARVGWIEAPPPVLDAAARIFGGPQPWMPDSF